MATIARKTIEEYYGTEWSDLVSTKTLNFLIELTCQACLGYNIKPLYEKQSPKLQNLGQV